MNQVLWLGVKPPPLIRMALERAGISVVLKGAGVRVVATATGHRVPNAPGPDVWVWVVLRGPIPLQAATQAVRRGAYEVVAASEPPVLVARLKELLVPPDAGPPETPGVIAGSPAARRLLDQIFRAARTNMPVLLTGETGTGKEVAAGLVHLWSRRSGAYVPVNCAAIPNDLMESELFGHMRGAFSGAIATVDGKLLAARGGTVFLDEIDDTPLSVQAKLLRVLEDGEVARLGETATRPADFRLIAASNRDLLRLVEDGRFGLDFYERLAIVRIELPRLRDRLEDLPAFARHFIARFYDRQNLPRVVFDLSASALAFLSDHPWPGNIRELRNVIYQSLVARRGRGPELLLSDVQPWLEARRDPIGSTGVVSLDLIRTRMDEGRFNLRKEVLALEKTALEHALSKSGGRASGAVRFLGEVGRGGAADPGGTVRAMMKRLGVMGG